MSLLTACAVLLWLASVGTGEWIVHQISYFITYGSRFERVMGSTPHRLYMAPLGVALGLLLALSLSAILLAGFSGTRRFERAIEKLPSRLRTCVPRADIVPDPAAYFSVVSSLALAQTVVYVLQENLEAHAAQLPWPGLSVVFSWNQGQVIPLQVILALFTGAVVTVVLKWSELVSRRYRTAKHLAALLTTQPQPSVRLRPHRLLIPDLRCTIGSLCLRSPPQLV